MRDRENECPDCGMEIGTACECRMDYATGQVIHGGFEAVDMGWDSPSPVEPSSRYYPCCGAYWEDGCQCEEPVVRNLLNARPS